MCFAFYHFVIQSLWAPYRYWMCWAKWKSHYDQMIWNISWTRLSKNSNSEQVTNHYLNIAILNLFLAHDDVIKWTHFPRYWPFVRGIHRSPVNSPYKGQWRGALMFSLICVWINGWVNNREAGDLRRYHAHYDITVMNKQSLVWPTNVSHYHYLPPPPPPPQNEIARISIPLLFPQKILQAIFIIPVHLFIEQSKRFFLIPFDDFMTIFTGVFLLRS